MPGDDAVVHLLAELERCQVRLRVEGDRLRCVAPTGVLTEALLDEVRSHKFAILNYLRGRHAVPVARRREPIPLSFPQEQVWLAQHLRPTSSAYHIPLLARLAGELRPACLRHAVAELVRRHEALRTSYPVRRGRPGQRIEPHQPPALPLVDLSTLPVDLRDATLAALSSQSARRPFDLGAGPVMRGSLVRYGPAEHRFMLTRHHIASDGWSFTVLGSELSSHYTAARAGKPSPMSPLTRQYVDYAVWQRDAAANPAHQRQLEVWRKRLAGATWSLNLVGSSSPARGGAEPQTAPASRLSLRLPAEAARRVGQAARDLNTTSFTILLTAFGLALASASGQSDLVVAVPTSGRTRVELEPLIGCFASLLALRLTFTGTTTVRQAVRIGHEVVTEALTNQDVPPERVWELAGAARRHLRYGPISVSFTFQNTPTAWVNLPGVTVELADPVPVVARFPLAVTVSRGQSGELDVIADYDAGAIDAGSVADVLTRFAHLVTRGGHHLDVPIADLALRSTPPATSGPVQLTRRDSLPAAFAVIANRTPDAIAVSQAGAHLSYRGLRERAATLAACLRTLGVRTETRVGLALDHCPDLVVAVVGVTLSGGAYVPIDLEDPPARREAVLTDAAARIIVTQAAHADEFAWFDGAVVCVDQLPPKPAVPSMARLPPADANAYVIYTSGSTGAPKGVMVSHANVVSVLSGAVSVIAATAQDVWSLTHASAFDFSVWEMWAPLLTGGRVAVVPRGAARDPGELWRILSQEQVTVLSATPSACYAVTAAMGGADGGASAAAVRLVVLGGERCEPGKLRGWISARDVAGPAVVNMYGITETTVHVTWRPLTVPDTVSGLSPIGVALPGVRLYAVDRDGTPIAVRGQGELLVGGAGVARGYLDRPGLTADRFRPDHLGPAPGARLYRSGDVGRPAPGGGFDYLGRLDQQIKVRGYRIEPGEIEVALAGHRGVRAVAVGERAEKDRSTLVAYVVAGRSGHEPPPSGRELRRYLLDRLPAYLVPATYIFVDALPLTRNGKLDQAALASLSADATPVADADLPRTPTEKALAQLWCELLDVNSVGIHDDFFDLGGDSLLVTRLHGRLPGLFGVRLPMRRIYQALDIASLAAAIDALPQERGHE